MPTKTELVMHRKTQEVLEEELKTACRKLRIHMAARSFLIPLDKAIGREGATFIMFGPVGELQQLAARNLR